MTTDPRRLPFYLGHILAAIDDLTVAQIVPTLRSRAHRRNLAHSGHGSSVVSP